MPGTPEGGSPDISVPWGGSGHRRVTLARVPSAGMGDPAIDDALLRVTGELAGHEDRPSQREMAQAVAGAIREHRHLIVQAGTGTGKSLAYLVPALALGARVVVATATKALQDQLAQRDLPLLVRSLDERLEFAVLKGRSNYACAQRVLEVAGGDQQVLTDGSSGDPAGFDASTLGPLGRELRRLVTWAGGDTVTGDRAELAWEPSESAWAQVSVGSRECPGASRCPSGDKCFAEAARDRAGQADVVIVNTHLYATSLVTGGELLPPHDVVVFDEAHELEDITSSALGFELGAGRMLALARLARPLLDDSASAAALEDAAVIFQDLVRPHHGATLPRPLPGEDGARLALVRERVAGLQADVRRAMRSSSGGDRDQARHHRSIQASGHLLRDLDHVMELSESNVAWVEGPTHSPVVRVAPLDVGEALGDLLWSRVEGPTAVMTSATIPPRLSDRLGVPAGSYDQLDVGSPYAYDEQALLYCPLHLPDPRDPSFEAAMHEELLALIMAAEGRTLALFTSWRAMGAAAEALRARVPWTLLTQSELPKPALIARFSQDEHACLFATMGFWQGVDVPGPSLSVVTIDKLPFPRPDDPLLQARRALLGRAAFDSIDIPRAATLLAQGTGRLIRSSTDKGVVVVFDNRLAKARYRWSLVNALPPMRRTRHRADVEAFLAQIHSERGTPATPGG
jgi:ATP-dependent DNA helicase DinG